MNRPELANFLRSRRELLQPEDVGLPRGSRRRTGGLRREEIATLSGVSSDYYTRIEQQRGPVPSEQVLAALAQGLRLTRDERDHMLRLAGHPVPHRNMQTSQVNGGMVQVLSRIENAAAQIENHLGVTLRQNHLAVALLGVQTAHTGLRRSRIYRWFTDPAERSLLFEEDQAVHGRTLTALLAAAYARAGEQSSAGTIVDHLRQHSQEFADLWASHPIVGPHCEPKRLRHPTIGPIEISGQNLLDSDHSQTLMVLTAPPNTESEEKLQFLARAQTSSG